MLAAHQLMPSSSPNNYAYLPAIPSPLSPRSANIHGRHNAEGYGYSQGYMAEDASAKIPRCDGSNRGNDENTPSMFQVGATAAGNANANATQERVPYCQRAVKKAPIPKTEDLRGKRRGAYLRKVQDQRDEKRFESRGEDMMRLEFMRRQRAWEEERAREAAIVASQEGAEEDADEYDLPVYEGVGSQIQMQISSSAKQVPEEEIEEFLRDEEGELEALLELMPGEQQHQSRQRGDEDAMDREDETILWSDDADYDALFSEVLSQQGPQTTQQQQSMDVQYPDGEEMDMS